MPLALRAAIPKCAPPPPQKERGASVLFYQRIARGAGGKGPRQKTSKIAKKCRKVFRHFSTIFARGKKRQKSSKNVKKFFDTFRQFSRRAPFFRPLLGGSNFIWGTFDLFVLLRSFGGKMTLRLGIFFERVQKAYPERA